MVHLFKCADRNLLKRFKRKVWIEFNFSLNRCGSILNIFPISQSNSMKCVMWQDTCSRRVKKIKIFIEGKKIVLCVLLLLWFFFDWRQLELNRSVLIRFAHWNGTQWFSEPNRKPLNKTGVDSGLNKTNNLLYQQVYYIRVASC